MLVRSRCQTRLEQRGIKQMGSRANGFKVTQVRFSTAFGLGGRRFCENTSHGCTTDSDTRSQDMPCDSSCDELTFWAQMPQFMDQPFGRLRGIYSKGFGLVTDCRDSYFFNCFDPRSNCIGMDDESVGRLLGGSISQPHDLEDIGSLFGGVVPGRWWGAIAGPLAHGNMANSRDPACELPNGCGPVGPSCGESVMDRRRRGFERACMRD